MVLKRILHVLVLRRILQCAIPAISIKVILQLNGDFFALFLFDA